MHQPQVAGRWRKSRHSQGNSNCVEFAPLVSGGIGVRDSKDPNGPVLVFTKGELAAMLAGAKDGDFDELLS